MQLHSAAAPMHLRKVSYRKKIELIKHYFSFYDSSCVYDSTETIKIALCISRYTRLIKCFCVPVVAGQ